jgi:molybdopterin molybdotransferase
VLAAGCAVAISTGARLPDGADAVIPREDASELDGTLEIAQAIRPGAFVRLQGDDLRAGDLVLPRGLRIAPHHLAVAAGTGHADLCCVRRPRVALVVTGDELISVGEERRAGQIWDISSIVMPALIRGAGGEVLLTRTISDDPVETQRVLAEALEVADLVLTTGGVSVGDHDFLRPAFAQLGVDELFWGVRIRTGHPTWFGRRGATRVLALPGNPVAGVVCFWVFGRTLLGRDDTWTMLPLAVDYRTPTPRADLIRCVIGPDGLVPSARQASHQVTSLAGATHIALVPEGALALRKGDHIAAVALTG